MAYVQPRSTAVVEGRHIYSMLSQFPAVCFTLTLLTDIAYWRTANLMWQNFSSWLLFIGLVFGAFAVVAGIVEAVFRWRVGATDVIWPQAIGGIAVLLLAFLNALVHAGDGWTAVVPWGLTLSVITVLIMLITDGFAHAVDFYYSRGGVRDYE